MDKKAVLVTGAAGNVGRMLVPILRERFTLRLCDIVPIPEQGGLEVIQADLAEPARAREAVAGMDGVVHLAGLVTDDATFEDTLNPNYRALLALLDGCRREGVGRFVFASSHHAVGLLPFEGPHDETAPIAPDNFYGLSKAFGEAACALYALRFGIASLAIRIGSAGPDVVDGRRERIWISDRDLAQLITIGLTNPKLKHHVVYGVSDADDPMFINSSANHLNYRPLDSSRDRRSKSYRAYSDFGAADGVGLVGGFYAACALPMPWSKS